MLRIPTQSSFSGSRVPVSDSPRNSAAGSVSYSLDVSDLLDLHDLHLRDDAVSYLKPAPVSGHLLTDQGIDGEPVRMLSRPATPHFEFPTLTFHNQFAALAPPALRVPTPKLEEHNRPDAQTESPDTQTESTDLTPAVATRTRRNGSIKVTLPITKERHKYRRATAAVKAKILRLLKVGYSYATCHTHQEIANMTGATIDTVKKVADANGIVRGTTWKKYAEETHVVKMLALAGKTPAEIVALTGYRPAFLDRIKKNEANHATDQKHKSAEMLSRLHNGEDYAAIADAMNCSYTTVKKYASGSKA